MLREETVEPGTLELLKNLVSLPELENFRLVGGTALSLLFGHRKSVDLDLFIDQPLQKDILIPALVDNFGQILTINDRSKQIYQCVIQNVKVDLVSVSDSFINPITTISGIPFAHIKDLIALKLNAVKGRGAKKDFWDVARLLQEYCMDDMLQFYQDRFYYDDTFSVLRSMTFFADAEDDIDPESLDGMTWDEIKKAVIFGMDERYKKFKN